MPATRRLFTDQDRRVLGNSPSVWRRFRRNATEPIRQIEVDQAVVLGEPDRDLVLRTIELGLRLQSTLRAALSTAGLIPER